MSASAVLVFADHDGLHTIGVEDPEQAYELMMDYAESHGLEIPETDPHDIRFRACINARTEGGTVTYDRVDEREDAQRLFTLDWD